MKTDTLPTNSTQLSIVPQFGVGIPASFSSMLRFCLARSCGSFVHASITVVVSSCVLIKIAHRTKQNSKKKKYKGLLFFFYYQHA